MISFLFCNKIIFTINRCQEHVWQVQQLPHPRLFEVTQLTGTLCTDMPVMILVSTWICRKSKLPFSILLCTVGVKQFHNCWENHHNCFDRNLVDSFTEYFVFRRDSQELLDNDLHEPFEHCELQLRFNRIFHRKLSPWPSQRIHIIRRNLWICHGLG